MRIVCPSCAAAYEVPDARLMPGKPVRCARCGTNWTPAAELEPAADFVRLLPPAHPLPFPQSGPMAPDAQIFSTPSPLAATDRGRGLAGGPAVLAGWVLSIALLLGLGWMAVIWRSDIMHVWPPSERLYSTLGLLAER